MVSADQFTDMLAQLAQARRLLQQSLEPDRPQAERAALLRAAQRIKNEVMSRMN